MSALLQLKGKDTNAGWDYLDKLNENVAQYVHSGSKPAKMAAAGECAVGISFGYAGISQKEKGAPVDVVFPKEGSGWDLEANALINKEKINPAAMQMAVMIASEKCKSPLIISPLMKSRKEFVIRTPGIKSMIFPIMIISICCPIRDSRQEYMPYRRSESRGYWRRSPSA